MSSGLHLSRELHDLIKSIGEARSKQEEDNLIRRDIIDLKKKVLKMTGTPRELKERALRAIYAEMMGHDIEFTHFFIVNLCQNKSVSVKRAGYLAATLLLREDNQFIIMLVATLQKDLLSTSTYDILIALNTLCKLMSGNMVTSFVEIIERLLAHTNTLIRKKAFCVYQKILQISPSSCTNPIIKIKDSLADDNASVMGVGLNLIYDEIRKDPSQWKDITKQLTGQFCQVLDHKLHKDYDFQRLPAPWFQIRFLQIFSLLGKNDKKVSGELYDAVEKALKRADDTITDAGFAVTYQCVKTITQLYPNPALLDKASKTIGRFFSPIPDRKTNPTNLKYLGIEAMRALVATHPKLASEHQLMIVDCLEHPDESIRRVTLELLYKTTNSNNLELIIEKMIKTLKSSYDERLKKDLVFKIYELNERLAPDPEFFVQKTNILFQYGSEGISNSMLARTIKTIEANLAMADDGSFGSNLIQVYYDFIQEPLPDVFIKLIAWIYGEVGSMIYQEDPSSLEQIGFQLRNLLAHKMTHGDTVNWIYSGLAKIKACANFTDSFIGAIFDEAKTSDNYEIRQRAHEYSSTGQGIVSIAKIAPYDSNLTFLKDFIEAGIKKGAKKYDPTKVGVLGKMNSAMKGEDLGLLTAHRQADLTAEPGNGGDMGGDEGIVMAKGGQKIFGAKKVGDSTGMPKKAEPLNFAGAGSGDDHNNIFGKVTAPVKAKEDPKAAQRRAQAAKIFGGNDNVSLFGTGAKPKTTA
jgi:AP-4 complex subunit epsilon-1